MPECDHFLELGSALIDGELDDQRANTVRSHLDLCDSCRLAYREMAATSRALDIALASVRAPESLRTAILPILDVNPTPVERPHARRRARWRLLWGPAVAVAAALILALTHRGQVPLQTLNTVVVESSAPSSIRSPQQAARVVSEQTGLAVQAVSLEEMGLTFVSGGKTDCAGCPGAYLAFKDKEGHYVTVFELCTRQRRLPAGETLHISDTKATRLKALDGGELVFWPQNGLLFVVSTDLSAEHAARASRIIASQIQTD